MQRSGDDLNLFNWISDRDGEWELAFRQKPGLGVFWFFLVFFDIIERRTGHMALAFYYLTRFRDMIMFMLGWIDEL